MGMATNTQDDNQIKKEFDKLREIFQSLKENNFKSGSNFKELSMGMSGDYSMAILSGSTMIRVGSKIFS